MKNLGKSLSIAAAAALSLCSGVCTADVVVSEDFQTGWYNGKEVQWDGNWVGVANNNGFQTADDGTGNFQAVNPFGWRGGTHTTAITGWDVGETITITLDYTPGFTTNANDYKQMFGLTDIPATDTSGANMTMAATRNDTLGFAMESNFWPGPASGQSTQQGTLKMLAYKGAPNADGISQTTEDWGMDFANGDFQGDKMALTWTATKEATAGEFTLGISIENTVNATVWTNSGITHTDTDIYNASTLYFTTDSYQSNASVSSADFAWDNLEVDLSINAVPEPATASLLGFGIFGLLARRRR